MKRIVYSSLFLLLLSSCDSCRAVNYAHVEFRDSTRGNFLLQSFSDSTLRLLNFYNDSMLVVPFHNIRRFVLQGDEIDLYTPQGKAQLQKSLELKILW